MRPITHIADLFGRERQQTQGSEDFISGQWVFSFSDWLVPTAEAVFEGIKEFPLRDKVRLKARVGSASSLTLNSPDLAEAKEFVSSLETYKATDNAPYTLELTFEVQKGMADATTSVFSLNDFATTMRDKTLPQLHTTFNAVCKLETPVSVQVFDSSKSFETMSLKFNPASVPAGNLRRTQLFLKRKDLCHFDGCTLPFLPEDYWLEKRSHHDTINDIFDRLCLMAILTFVADVSSLSDNGKFVFKINGYRAVTGEIETGKVSDKLVAEFFKIYQWAYADDHAPDKLGLARNIISLHWKDGICSNPFEAGAYDSILSGFDVYLKKHVDQYIALKNRLSDYLSDLSQKSAKLADSVIEKLEKNFLAFAGFFISTILIKVVSDKSFPEFLPHPLRVIAWGLLGFSLLHGVVSLIFSLRERRSYIEDFQLLRTRYADLLSPADLDRVLNCDEGKKKITKNLDFKLWLFYTGWLVSLLLCAVLIWQLSKQPVGGSKENQTKTAAPAAKISQTNSLTDGSDQLMIR
jgi:hypothetical protein